MGEHYRKNTGDIGNPTTSPEMRALCQRQGNSDKDGKPIYFTEQAHKDQCDVNKIIAKYDRSGVITHINTFEAQFGDLSGVDYKMMKDKVARAQTMFEQLPSNIRNEFDNNAEHLLHFMDNPNNRDKAISMGLIPADSHPDTDGLGEHVKENHHQAPPEPPPAPEPAPAE